MANRGPYYPAANTHQPAYCRKSWWWSQSGRPRARPPVCYNSRGSSSTLKTLRSHAPERQRRQYRIAALLCVCCIGAGTPVGADAQRGWYASAALGAGTHSGMEQEGWNRDTVCYPTDACFFADPVPAIPGYRWRYDIDADTGAALEIGVGRYLRHFRMELSAAWRQNGLAQQFAGIEYLDGSPRLAANGPVADDVMASINDAVTRSVSLHAFRDLRPIGSIAPYVGAGVGRAFVKVGGVRFVAEYRDASASPAHYDPPLSFYASETDGEFSDSAIVWHLHAGADYPLGDRTSVGARATWSQIAETSDTGTYTRHAMHLQDPGFTNRTVFGTTRSWSLTLSIRRQFGALL